MTSPVARGLALLAAEGEPALSGPASYLVIALGVVVLMATMLRFRRRAQKAREEAGQSAPSPADAALVGRTEGSLRRSVDAMIAELADGCRQTSAQLETRIRVLHELIAQADRRIAELRALSARPAPPQPAPAAEARPAPQPAAPPDMPERFRRVYALADRGLDSVAIARETGWHRGEIDLMLSLRGAKGPAGQG